MKKHLDVLLVEDSPLAAEAIVRALRESGYDVTCRVVEVPAKLDEALSSHSWDVVVSDYVMPGFNGHDALAIYHRHQLETPFICVSGEIGEEEAAEIVRAGAHDFVSKSHLHRLGEVVARELAAAAERRERRHVAEQTAYLAAIVEGTDDAIFSRDMAGTILTWNAAAEKTYGYTAQEAIGQPISIIVPPDRLHELTAIRERLQSGQRIERMEVTRRRKDGTQIQTSITVSPIRNDRGGIIGASIIARDVTARNLLEQDRLKLIQDLQDALSKVKQLSGLLPICANCKRIRDDQGHWQEIELYVHEHSQADFTHGICPECARQLYPDIALAKGS